MTQAQYMTRLEELLKRMPHERRAEILRDIAEHFSEGVLQGKSEQELSAQLGGPELLAREYRAMDAAQRAEEKVSIGNIMRVIWAGIGMGMLNLILALPIALALFGVWLAFTVVGIALPLAGAVAGLAILVNFIVPLPFILVSYPWASLFGCIFIASLGSLIFIGMLWVSKRLYKAVIGYVRVNVSIISGRRKMNDE